MPSNYSCFTITFPCYASNESSSTIRSLFIKILPDGWHPVHSCMIQPENTIFYHNTSLYLLSSKALIQSEPNFLKHCSASSFYWSGLTADQGLNFIAAIAVEGEQNAVDHCGNDGNFLPYSVIFILFTVHYYFDTWIQMLTKSCVNYYFSLSCLRKRILKKYVNRE
jgi:hypothetical protein